MYNGLSSGNKTDSQIDIKRARLYPDIFEDEGRKYV